MPNAKRSWPLVLLAGCSFIPGCGLLFGAAGVSWGLVSDRPRARLAVVLGAAGALLAAIESYRKDTGAYPARLSVFAQLPYSLKLVNIQDFSAGVFRRPREYQYERSPDGRRYKLYGVGADGQPGTADDVYPQRDE